MIRLAVRFAGNVLILGSLLGLVALGLLLLLPDQIPMLSPSAPTIVGGQRAQTAQAGLPRPGVAASARTGTGSVNLGSDQASLATAFRPITHLEIPSIGLSVDVVPAALIERDGGLTWEVPAFKVGHAETTAGAGQLGNGVLLGHVTSLRSGNVFQDLDHVQVGDTVRVFAEADRFDYRVLSAAHVPRTDSTVLDQSDQPVVSLITCTGIWLPTIWDYTERLVVRAEFVDTR
jgi:LPXTG-site transpeptidase (sortase) family protein